MYTKARFTLIALIVLVVLLTGCGQTRVPSTVEVTVAAEAIEVVVTREVEAIVLTPAPEPTNVPT